MGFLRESVQPGKQPPQVLADHSLICQEHAQAARQSSKQYWHYAEGNYRLSVIFVATYDTPANSTLSWTATDSTAWCLTDPLVRRRTQ